METTSASDPHDVALEKWQAPPSGGRQRCGRFAPSTTGPAHLGTLLSALLAWCDARHFGGRVFLRLEDLDPARCQPAFATALTKELARLGLDFDQVTHQSQHHARHHDALQQLASAGCLYACACSRSTLAGQGPAQGGGPGARPRAHPHRCGAKSVDGRSWATTTVPLRMRLGAAPNTQDPVVRRRDGAVAYVLASVVDDMAESVTHVVRGRDLANLVPVQDGIYRALDGQPPLWRHHMLLCTRQGRKLAKLHRDGAGPGPVSAIDARTLCGWLGWAAGLQPAPEPTTPAALAARYRHEALERPDLHLFEAPQ